MFKQKLRQFGQIPIIIVKFEFLSCFLFRFWDLSFCVNVIIICYAVDGYGQLGTDCLLCNQTQYNCYLLGHSDTGSGQVCCSCLQGHTSYYY